jgi:thiol-disulfide isomerase/thioredoxin
MMPSALRRIFTRPGTMPMSQLLHAAWTLALGATCVFYSVGAAAEPYLGALFKTEARPGSTTAVVVTHVVPDSPADRAGIAPGDTVERIGLVQVHSATEADLAIVRSAGARALSVSYTHAGTLQTAAVGRVPRPTGEALLRALFVGRFEPRNAAAPAAATPIVGSVRLYYYWSTHCPPCRAGFSTLAALYAAYRPFGLTILALNSEAEEHMHSVAQRWGATVPVIHETEGAAPYPLFAYPTIVLVGRDNIVHNTWIGSVAEPELRRAVDAALTTASGN